MEKLCQIGEAIIDLIGQIVLVAILALPIVVCVGGWATVGLFLLVTKILGMW